MPVETVEVARRQYQRLHVAMLQTLSDAAALEARVGQLAANLAGLQVGATSARMQLVE